MIPYSGKVWQLLERRWRRGRCRSYATTEDEIRIYRKFCELRALMQEKPKPGRAGGRV